MSKQTKQNPELLEAIKRLFLDPQPCEITLSKRQWDGKGTSMNKKLTEKEWELLCWCLGAAQRVCTEKKQHVEAERVHQLFGKLMEMDAVIVDR